MGKDKQSLDEADANLNLVQVTTLFGSYIKYVVKTQNATKAISIPSTASLSINAFEIMIDSQKKLAMQTQPSRIDNVKNIKDKLRNDLLDQNNLSSEVSSEEEQLMSTYCGMWMHIMKLRNTKPVKSQQFFIALWGIMCLKYLTYSASHKEREMSSFLAITL